MGAARATLKPDLYCWTFPGAPVRIELQLDVAAKLRAAVRASPEVEIGGALLGYRTAQPRAVRITGFAAGEDGSVPGAVGFYRSHLREGLYLDESDLDRFGTPADVALLIRPEPHGEVTAGFFFWDEGEINKEFSFLEFPLEREELRETSPRRPAGARMAGLRRYAPWLALAAILLAVLAAAVWLPRRAAPPPQPAVAERYTPVLAFQARREGVELQFSWDTAPVRSARVGLLTIRERDAERAFPLTADQLRSGGFRYAPEGDSIRARLEVFGGDGKTISESLIALLPKPK